MVNLNIVAFRMNCAVNGSYTSFNSAGNSSFLTVESISKSFDHNLDNNIKRFKNLAVFKGWPKKIKRQFFLMTHILNIASH